MLRRPLALAAVLVTAVLVAAAVPATAGAVTGGSTLRSPPNLSFGCESALVLSPVTGAPQIVPSGQRTCTYRSGGYLFTNRLGSLVPSSGRITRIRVRSGRNPARLRLTILDSTPGREGQCCTARRFGRTFRPRANAITSVRTNVRVSRIIDPGTGVVSTDVVGLTAVGPGSLPLRYDGTGGTFRPGSALTSFWYPLTAIGDPRVEAYTLDGLELLFQWRLRRR